MRIKRFSVAWPVVLGTLVSTMTIAAIPARALEYGFSPALVCANEKESNEVVERGTKLLSPAAGATVPAGTAVTFSGESGVGSPLTFSVASSPALLSSPDIDSGPGSLQPGTSTYTFTSTKAAATPRTIYWDASFTRTLRDCEEPPVAFTTPLSTFTVSPSAAEAEATAKQKQEQEAAATAASEREAAADKAKEEAAKPKPLTRAQLLSKALRACKKQPKHKRKRCQAVAEKRYAPKSNSRSK